MSAVLSKFDQTPEPQPQASSIAVLDITGMIDELTELHSQVQAFEATQARYDSLKRQLADFAAQLSDDEVRLAGTIGYVVYAKPAQTRAINDIAKFFDTVGRGSFFQSVTVSTTKADKLLTATQKAELFEVSRGSRRLKDVGRISSVLFSSVPSAAKAGAWGQQ